MTIPREQENYLCRANVRLGMGYGIIVCSVLFLFTDDISKTHFLTPLCLGVIIMVTGMYSMMKYRKIYETNKVKKH